MTDNVTQGWGTSLQGVAHSLVVQAIDTLVIRESLSSRTEGSEDPLGLRKKVLALREAAIGQLEVVLREERAKLPEKQVRVLVDEWERQKMNRSDPAMDLPVFQELVAMGQVAVGPLLRLVKERWSWAILALHAITGETPWAEEDRGDLSRMTCAWLKWGTDRGLL
jgi:hypothetical protein